MAIADDKLQKFFSTQKIGAFDALKQKGKFNVIQNPAEKEKHFRDNELTLLKNDKSFFKIAESQIEEEKLNKPFLDLEKTINNQGNLSTILPNQSVSNPLAKHDQSVSVPLANREQSVNKPLAIRKQTVSKPLANREQIVSESLADPLANHPINLDINKSELNINLSIYSNKERELLNYIFWKCHDECSLTSPIITTDEIRQNIHVSPERLRNLIFRISKKGELFSKMFKSGQNACRIFEFTKKLYQALSSVNIKESKKENVPLADPLANTPYSSSNININTTGNSELPENWLNIDIEPLKEIGFSSTQLKQLYAKSKPLNKPEVIQESIHHFAFGLKHNLKFKKYEQPLNVIMGVLRGGGAWTEPNYQSPQILAQQQLLERKKAELEQLKKLEDEARNLALKEWKNSLSSEELKQIASSVDMGGIDAPNMQLSVYFNQKIWPRKKAEYLAS